MDLPFDPTAPPVGPPPDCRHRMTWLLARQLWAAHQPGPDRLCQVPGCSPAGVPHPCLPFRLAEQSLGYACEVPGAWTPSWRAFVRRTG